MKTHKTSTPAKKEEKEEDFLFFTLFFTYSQKVATLTIQYKVYELIVKFKNVMSLFHWFVELLDVTLEAILIHNWCILLSLAFTIRPQTTLFLLSSCHLCVSLTWLLHVNRPLGPHVKRRLTRYDSSAQEDTDTHSSILCVFLFNLTRYLVKILA